MRFLKNLLLLLISLALCALLVWLALPRLTPQPDEYPGYDQLVAYDPARPGGHLLPGRDLLVRSSRPNQPVRWVTNEAGFRAEREFAVPRPDEVYRVLLMGDSFIDGMRTDQSETIGAVLEALLQDAAPPGRRVEVMIGGHNNPANAWYNYQRHGHRYDPDWVILGITLGNDLTWHNFGGYVRPDGEALPSLLVEYSGGPVGVHDGWLELPQEAYRELTPAEQLHRLWDRAALALARRGGLFVNQVPPALGPRDNRPGKVYTAGFFVSLGLFQRNHDAFFEAMHEDLQSVLYGFDRLARHHGDRFSALLLPVRIQVQDEDWQRLVRFYRLDPGRFDLRQPNHRILAFCEREQIHCIDPLENLRRDYAKHGSLFLPLGDMHMNPAGQAAVARAVSVAVDFRDRAPRPPEADAADRVMAFQRTPCELCPSLQLPQDLADRWPYELNVREHGEAAAVIFTRGWSPPDGVVWTVASESVMRLPVPPGDGPVQLTLNLKPLVAADHPRQRVQFAIGPQPVGEWTLEDDRFSSRVLEIPRTLVAGPQLPLSLILPDAVSPAELGIGSDGRTLGVAIAGLRLADAGPAVEPDEQ